MDIVDDLAGHGQRCGIAMIETAACIEDHAVVPNLIIAGGTQNNSTNCL